ncbi:MAG: metal ABC transporter ATP-binding protein [Chloroflexi bacterium]|nr:metal ABC transporter ATP-binding protein [Chloroflexota bacterium]MDA1146688.1 metal ABC transporter ATP-binding protein [Chloroflexota bacterium]
MLHPHPHLPAPDGAPAVQLRDVSAGYQRGPVIHHIDLEIPQGDFVGLVGPSGSGKTTLLRVLLGTARLYGGEVLVGGERPAPGRQRIAYVPQLETVDWNFPVTAEQVVLMGASRGRRWLPWPSREDRDRARELMDRLGLGDLAGRHIRQLSGGQQQRVFLARALASDPHVLLLDEPTSGVDIKTRDDVLHLLDDLNHEGITVILTTHELNAVAAHLPWVVCINETVIAEGPPAEVFNPDTLRATYNADMPVLQYEGMTLVAERPHTLGTGRRRTSAHPVGSIPAAPGA